MDTKTNLYKKCFTQGPITVVAFSRAFKPHLTNNCHLIVKMCLCTTFPHFTETVPFRLWQSLD